jgi:hypothetical protein
VLAAVALAGALGTGIFLVERGLPSAPAGPSWTTQATAAHAELARALDALEPARLGTERAKSPGLDGLATARALLAKPRGEEEAEGLRGKLEADVAAGERTLALLTTWQALDAGKPSEAARARLPVIDRARGEGHRTGREVALAAARVAVALARARRPAEAAAILDAAKAPAARGKDDEEAALRRAMRLLDPDVIGSPEGPAEEMAAARAQALPLFALWLRAPDDEALGREVERFLASLKAPRALASPEIGVNIDAFFAGWVAQTPAETPADYASLRRVAWSWRAGHRKDPPRGIDERLRLRAAIATPDELLIFAPAAIEAGVEPDYYLAVILEGIPAMSLSGALRRAPSPALKLGLAAHLLHRRSESSPRDPDQGVQGAELAAEARDDPQATPSVRSLATIVWARHTLWVRKAESALAELDRAVELERAPGGDRRTAQTCALVSQELTDCWIEHAHDPALLKAATAWADRALEPERADPREVARPGPIPSAELFPRFVDMVDAAVESRLAQRDLVGAERVCRKIDEEKPGADWPLVKLALAQGLWVRAGEFVNRHEGVKGALFVQQAVDRLEALGWKETAIRARREFGLPEKR